MSSTKLTDGFEHHYRPAPDRVRAAFEHGMIVLDTNVLLNVLRYSPQARAELLEVLAGIADRCFVPYQVALEYNRNRVSVVSDRHQEIQTIATDIGSIRTKVRTVVNALTNRRTLSATEAENLETAVNAFFVSLDSAQTEAAAQYDLDPDTMAGRRDPWTIRLDNILKGHVGERPSEEALEADVQEGNKRKAAKVAPGFKDNELGDYLWWAEALRQEGLPGRALVVVSDDAAKGDWRFEERGFTIGPDPVLLEDVRKAGGSDLILLTTRDLLALVEELSPEKVSENTIAESEEVLSARQSSWTIDIYELLLATLEDEGYRDRVEVIRVAASQGGFVGRDHVYQIIGLTEQSRTLRQFATPVQRIMKSFIADGVLSSHAPDALRAVYEGAGKTIGYATPSEFSRFEDVASG